MRDTVKSIEASVIGLLIATLCACSNGSKGSSSVSSAAAEPIDLASQDVSDAGVIAIDSSQAPQCGYKTAMKLSFKISRPDAAPVTIGRVYQTWDSSGKALRIETRVPAGMREQILTSTNLTTSTLCLPPNATYALFVDKHPVGELKVDAAGHVTLSDGASHSVGAM